MINTVNMSEEHVWNGTTGTVLTTDDEGNIFVKLDVPFQDENGETKDQVRFTREMAKNLTYAYALTVHKSQGSEYAAVLLPWMARNAAAGAPWCIDTNTGAMLHQNGAMIPAEASSLVALIPITNRQ